MPTHKVVESGGEQHLGFAQLQLNNQIARMKMTGQFADSKLYVQNDGAEIIVKTVMGTSHIIIKAGNKFALKTLTSSGVGFAIGSQSTGSIKIGSLVVGGEGPLGIVDMFGYVNYLGGGYWTNHTFPKHSDVSNYPPSNQNKVATLTIKYGFNKTATKITNFTQAIPPAGLFLQPRITTFSLGVDGSQNRRFGQVFTQWRANNIDYDVGLVVENIGTGDIEPRGMLSFAGYQHVQPISVDVLGNGIASYVHITETLDAGKLESAYVNAADKASRLPPLPFIARTNDFCTTFNVISAPFFATLDTISHTLAGITTTSSGFVSVIDITTFGSLYPKFIPVGNNVVFLLFTGKYKAGNTYYSDTAGTAYVSSVNAVKHKLFKSTDGGLNFTELPLSIEKISNRIFGGFVGWQKLNFCFGEGCLAIPYAESDANNVFLRRTKILYTTDYGITWLSHDPLINGLNLNGMLILKRRTVSVDGEISGPIFGAIRAVNTGIYEYYVCNGTFSSWQLKGELSSAALSSVGFGDYSLFPQIVKSDYPVYPGLPNLVG